VAPNERRETSGIVITAGGMRSIDAERRRDDAAYMNSLSIDPTLDRCEVEYLHPDQVAPLIGQVIGRGDADRVASTFALLADPTRARILHALSLSEELCVCDLALLLGMSGSAVSHQLRLLRMNRAVERRKVGRIVYYRLADEHVRHAFADALRHATEPDPVDAA